MVAGMQKLLCLNIRQLGCRKFQPESKFLQQVDKTTSFLASLEEILTIISFNKFLPNQVIESGVNVQSNALEFEGAKFISTAKSNYPNSKLPAQANSIAFDNRKDEKTFNELKTLKELNFFVKISKETNGEFKQNTSFEMAEHFPNLISGKISIQRKQEKLLLSAEAKPHASLDFLEQGELEKNTAKTLPLDNSKEIQPKLGFLKHKDNIEHINKESQKSGLKPTKEEINNKSVVIKREEKPEVIHNSNTLRDNVVVEGIEEPGFEGVVKERRGNEVSSNVATVEEEYTKQDWRVEVKNKAEEVVLEKNNNEQRNNKQEIGLKNTKEEFTNKSVVIKREEKPEVIHNSNTLRDNVVVEGIEERGSEEVPKLTRVYEISTKIATIVESAREYPVKAEIVLQPKWLGTVIVEINVVKDNIEIMFKCENKEALQLIENNLVQLREKLQNLGFEKQYFTFQQHYEGGESFLNSKSDRQHKQEEEALRRQFLHSFFRNKEFDSNSFINEWGENVYRH